MDKTPQDIVTDFCKAWERRSLGDVLSYLAPDIVYQNVPSPAMRGIEEAERFLAPLINNSVKIDFELLSIAVSISGDSVLTERMDRLHFAGGVVDIPVMGNFVVRSGKIVEWRDYTDSAAITSQFERLRSASTT